MMKSVHPYVTQTGEELQGKVEPGYTGMKGEIFRGKKEPKTKRIVPELREKSSSQAGDRPEENRNYTLRRREP